MRQSIAAEASRLEHWARRAEGTGPISVALVHRVLEARSLRRSMIEVLDVGDHAWDMLLKLYAAHLEGAEVTAGQLAAAAGCPATTALRYTGAFADRGIIDRQPSSTDGRKVLLRLTAGGVSMLVAYFAELDRRDLPIG